MPGLLIRDLPDDIHARLSAQAKASHRSLSAQAIALLELALADPAGPPPLEEIDRLRVRGARPLTQDILDRARTMGRR